MMIEGGARWGYDPVWEGDDDIIPVVDSEKTTAQACENKREKRHFILEQHLQSQTRLENYLEHKKSILQMAAEPDDQNDSEKADKFNMSANMKYDFSEPPQPTHYLG